MLLGLPDLGRSRHSPHLPQSPSPSQSHGLRRLGAARAKLQGLQVMEPSAGLPLGWTTDAHTPLPAWKPRHTQQSKLTNKNPETLGLIANLLQKS